MCDRKADLGIAVARDGKFRTVKTSALTGDGIDELRRKYGEGAIGAATPRNRAG